MRRASRKDLERHMRTIREHLGPDYTLVSEGAQWQLVRRSPRIHSLQNDYGLGSLFSEISQKISPILSTTKMFDWLKTYADGVKTGYESAEDRQKKRRRQARAKTA